MRLGFEPLTCLDGFWDSILKGVFVQRRFPWKRIRRLPHCVWVQAGFPSSGTRHYFPARGIIFHVRSNLIFQPPVIRNQHFLFHSSAQTDPKSCTVAACWACKAANNLHKGGILHVYSPISFELYDRTSTPRLCKLRSHVGLSSTKSTLFILKTHTGLRHLSSCLPYPNRWLLKQLNWSPK